MKISELLEAPCAQILFYLYEEREVRYSKLAEFIQSPGTLSLNLKHLEQEGLIKRRIVTTKPIQSFYSLTERGMRVARKLVDIRKVI
jgi:DNA-binding HxlR family transcriptional regulator